MLHESYSLFSVAIIQAKREARYFGLFNFQKSFAQKKN